MRIEKDMLPSRLVDIDRTGTIEMVKSMKIDMLDHLIEGKEMRKSLRRRKMKRRKGVKRNLMVHLSVLNMARKAILLGSVQPRCLRLRF